MANTAATSPQTMADDATVGTVAWSNPDNAKASDNVYATATAPGSPSVTSHYLKATNFGFSIPSGATINGILVQMEVKQGTTNGGVMDSTLKIIKSDGSLGTTNKAVATNWPRTEAYISRPRSGASTDLWGETWAYSDINNSNFGVAISAKGMSTDFSPTAFVDHIRITVYYTEVSGVKTLASLGVG